MAEIIPVNGRPVIDYMARDFDSLLQAMRDQIPSKLSEWTDNANEADFGNVLLELFAYLGDILSYYQDRVANESFLSTAQTRRSVIEHLRLIGYRLATAAPAAASLVVTVPSDFAGTVTIHTGDAFATKSQQNKPSVRFEYTGNDPLVLDFNQPEITEYPAHPSLSGYIWTDAQAGTKTFVSADPITGKPRLFGPPGCTEDGAPFSLAGCRPLGYVPVEEGQLIQDEFVGQSDDTPNQRFTLAHPRLISRPFGTVQGGGKDISLVTQLGDARVQWTLQESLAFSRANQTDYVIEIDENDQATIIFGDGALGAKPPNGATITVTYRIGGGVAGNVPADAIQTIVNGPELALAAGKVTNPLPATGGADREDIPHAVLHAPSVFRSLKRAVTAADYVALASSFKGVGKVQAASTAWNRVTLYVAPQGGGKVSDVLESDLLAFFEDKRVLGQIVEISDVDYVPIFVTATLTVQSYYSRADVMARVRAACARLLAFDNVDFGETLYLSKFYETIQDVEGVVGVNIREFSRVHLDPPVIPADGRIALSANEVPVIPDDEAYALGVNVSVEKGGF